MVMATSGPTQQFRLGFGPLTCHAWNADRSRLAFSANSSDIHIVKRGGSGWEVEAVLSAHTLPVTGLDWGPRRNRIVSCSQDKDAFVWTLEEGSGEWKPELVLVRLNRAATTVQWSPKENKFAVGSGAKCVSVCYYDAEGAWWIAKQIKSKIKSTVTSLHWHPNNILLAVGSCDFKTRVFSGYIKEVDEKPGPTPWGAKMPLGNLMSEYSSGGGGWVHSVQFSPSGNRLAWVGHDSSLSVVDANDVDNGAEQQREGRPPRIGCMTTIKEWYLPFTTLTWVSESSIVAAGHDCCPLLFSFQGPNRLSFVSKLDIPPEAKENKFSAMSKFRNLDKSNAESVDSRRATLHQNTITQVCPHSGDRGRVTSFSTIGIDGLLVIWDLKALEARNAGIVVS